MRKRHWAEGYLIAQSFAVFAWWIWLLAEPSATRYFVGPRLPAHALRPYLFPDLALYGIGGLATALLLHKAHPYGRACLLILAGGILYATLSTLGLALESQGGWIGVPLMVASFAGTAFFAWRLRPRS